MWCTCLRVEFAATLFSIHHDERGGLSTYLARGSWHARV